MEKTGKRSNFFKSALVLMLLVPCMFLLAACGGKADFKVDASIAKVDGITVTLDKELTKKEFSTDNGDSQSRVDTFGDLGELDLVTIRVSGTVSRADCDENATAMNAEGDVVAEGETVVYYTDVFELKMLVPKDATKYYTKDGLPAKEIAELENVEDGYIVEKVQWLLGDANKTWNICGSADTNDGYFYYSFLNDSDEVVKEFFVRVVYDVEFVA